MPIVVRLRAPCAGADLPYALEASKCPRGRGANTRTPRYFYQRPRGRWPSPGSPRARDTADPLVLCPVARMLQRLRVLNIVGIAWIYPVRRIPSCECREKSRTSLEGPSLRPPCVLSRGIGGTPSSWGCTHSRFGRSWLISEGPRENGFFFLFSFFSGAYTWETEAMTTRDGIPLGPSDRLPSTPPLHGIDCLSCPSLDTLSREDHGGSRGGGRVRSESSQNSLFFFALFQASANEVFTRRQGEEMALCSSLAALVPRSRGARALSVAGRRPSLPQPEFEVFLATPPIVSRSRKTQE